MNNKKTIDKKPGLDEQVMNIISDFQGNLNKDNFIAAAAILDNIPTEININTEALHAGMAGYMQSMLDMQKLPIKPRIYLNEEMAKSVIAYHKTKAGDYFNKK